MKYFLLLIQAIVALKAVNEVKVSFQNGTHTAQDFRLQFHKSVFTSQFSQAFLESIPTFGAAAKAVCL